MRHSEKGRRPHGPMFRVVRATLDGNPLRNGNDLVSFQVKDRLCPLRQCPQNWACFPLGRGDSLMKHDATTRKGRLYFLRAQLVEHLIRRRSSHMKASVLFSGVATFLALAGCKTTAPGEASQTGGVTSTGGEPQSGGGSGGSTGSVATTTSSGGTTAAGGATGNGGSTTAGGTMGSGGSTAAGGATGNGGSTAAGGTKTTGGTNLSGGSSAERRQPSQWWNHQFGRSSRERGERPLCWEPRPAGGTTASYQGPCDVLASGCAEAYSVAQGNDGELHRAALSARKGLGRERRRRSMSARPATTRRT